MPELSEINFVPGMIESISGSWNSDEGKRTASKIIKELKALEQVIDTNNNDTIDEALGYFYEFLRYRRASEYGYDLVDMLRNENESLQNIAIKTGIIFMQQAIHQEPVKFGICMSWLYSNDTIDEMLFLLGLVDNFSIYVTCSFECKKQNNNVFEMAKLTDGYGKLNYIKGLDAINNDIKAWLIYEGYKNSLGDEFSAFICAKNGDLLWHIKNGWNEKLYDCTGDIIVGIQNSHSDSWLDYEDLKEILTLYINESANYELDIDRAYKICEIYFLIRDYGLDLKITHDECERLKSKISDIIWSDKYDWNEIIRQNIGNFKVVHIAKSLGIDIWDELYEYSVENKNHDNWYTLSLTDDIGRFKKLCLLAENTLDLDKIGSGIANELGLNGDFGSQTALSMILQRLNSFDEIIGINLVKVGLNSPVISTRNMALKAVTHWTNKFSEVLNIVKTNSKLDPSNSTKEYYDEILKINA